MAKISQVTNIQELNEMCDRIKDCAIAIANPVTSEAKKAEYRIAYGEMCEKVQTYYNKERERHTRMVLLYPGLKDVYKQIGYEFDEPNDDPDPIEPIPEEIPAPAPEPKVDYAAFLDD